MFRFYSDAVFDLHCYMVDAAMTFWTVSWGLMKLLLIAKAKLKTTLEA